MRPTQKQNRTRGRGSRKPSAGSNLNRVFESNGPEGKVRGTPQQIVDKYLSLARDAQTSDDRVVAENFLQHAEHYQRLLLEAAPNTEDRRDHPSEQDQPDVESMDGDTDTRSDPERKTPQMDVVRTSSDPERSDRHGSDRHGSDRHGNNRQESDRYGSERNGSARSRRSADVSGLTTIDSGGGDSNSLLVDAEDLSASQPRRRPRAPAPDRQPAVVQPVEPAPAEAAPAEAKPSGEASPELQSPTTESQPE